MKLSQLILVVSLGIPAVTPFSAQLPLHLKATPMNTATSTSSVLHLFGSGGGKDSEKKGPGMFDQLNMLKKAQEMAQKKKTIDDELAKLNFPGVGADGKVKGVFKYVPVTNPMDPNPEYEPISFEFDDEFFTTSTPEEIAAAVKAAYINAVDNTNKVVAERYAVLQSDIMEALGQKAQ